MPDSASDILAIVKAEIKTLPEFPGTVVGLIDRVGPKTKESVEKVTQFFEQKLTSFGSRIDASQIKDDDFSELFKSCLGIAARTHREEKLQAAANILANLFLRTGDAEKSSYAELDHLIRCLDNLSIGAISVLGAVRHLVRRPAGGMMRGSVHPPQLRDALPEIEPSLIMSLLSELRALNLVRVQEGGIRLADDSQALVELTDIGDRFVRRFIEGGSI